MVFTAPEPTAEWQSVGEQRTILRGLSWAAYLQIIASLNPSRNSHLTYDEGVLEITIPLESYQFSCHALERFIRTLSELMERKLERVGSITMNYPDLQKGAEPDLAYYLQYLPFIRERAVDFSQVPPPDLVVEIDITPTHIAKNQFYASLGVSELWRYNGTVWRIYQLQNDVYLEVECSPLFPQVPKTKLYAFLEQMRKSEGEAVQQLLAWGQHDCSHQSSVVSHQ